MVRRCLHPMFKGRHFDHEIIILCVRWYVSYKLSHRDLAAMMLERGVAVAALEHRMEAATNHGGLRRSGVGESTRWPMQQNLP